MPKEMKVILCIGGSDPSGGAGIQIDIPTVFAHNSVPLTAITAVTSQNSQGVYDLFIPEPQTLRMQLEVLNKDYSIDAVKVGMLGNANNVRVVVGFIKESGIDKVIVDPIFKSSTSFDMLDIEGVSFLKEELLKVAMVVTPNIDEAEKLSEFNIKNTDDMQKAAAIILKTGVDSVIIKGGHLPGDTSTDVVHNNKDTELIESKRIDSDLRGTGCIFSSSLASNLANGLNLLEAAEKAHLFVVESLRNGKQIGNGMKQVTKF